MRKPRTRTKRRPGRPWYARWRGFFMATGAVFVGTTAALLLLQVAEHRLS